MNVLHVRIKNFIRLVNKMKNKKIKTNLDKFEIDWEILEPLFISKESTLEDFDFKEGDIIIRIRKKIRSK